MFFILPPSLPPSLLYQGSLDNWVLCRIFLKKRGTTGTKNDNPVEIPQSRPHTTHKANRALTPVFYDFMANNNNRRRRRKTTRDLNLAPASSSSGSSGITEASSSDDPEETTSCNTSSTFTTKRTLA